jgi:hypothetical protein
MIFADIVAHIEAFYQNLDSKTLTLIFAGVGALSPFVTLCIF